MSSPNSPSSVALTYVFGKWEIPPEVQQCLLTIITSVEMIPDDSVYNEEEIDEQEYEIIKTGNGKQ